MKRNSRNLSKNNNNVRVHIIIYMEEPLKISEAINLLNTIKEEHGDINIGTWNDGILRFIRSIK